MAALTAISVYAKSHTLISLLMKRMNNGHIGLLILLIIALCIIGMLMHEKPSTVVNEIVVVDTSERDSLLEVIP